jgi:hypothetical protein
VGQRLLSIGRGGGGRRKDVISRHRLPYRPLFHYILYGGRELAFSVEDLPLRLSWQTTKIVVLGAMEEIHVRSGSCWEGQVFLSCR